MSIYTGDSSIKVSNASKGTEILDRMLMSQYANSPNYIAYCKAFIEEMDFLFKSVEDVYLGMLLESAGGDQLDKLGAILGQSRSVDLPELYFGFVGADLSEGFSDDNDPLSGGVFRDSNSVNTDVLSDGTYRRILLARAVISNMDVCSISNLYYIISIVLGRIPKILKIIDLGGRRVKLVLGVGEVTTPEVLLIDFISPLFVPLGVKFDVELQVVGAATIEASSDILLQVVDSQVIGNVLESSVAISSNLTDVSISNANLNTGSSMDITSSISADNGPPRVDVDITILGVGSDNFNTFTEAGFSYDYSDNNRYFGSSTVTIMEQLEIFGLLVVDDGHFRVLIRHDNTTGAIPQDVFDSVVVQGVGTLTSASATYTASLGTTGSDTTEWKWDTGINISAAGWTDSSSQTVDFKNVIDT